MTHPLCQGIRNCRFDGLTKAPPTAASSHSFLVCGDGVIWRSNDCWKSINGPAQTPLRALIGSVLCAECQSAKRNLHRRLKDLEQKMLRPGKAATVRRDRRNPLVYPQQISADDLGRLLQNPQQLEAHLQSLVSRRSRHTDEQHRAKMRWYAGTLSLILNLFWSKMSGGRVSCPAALCNLVVIHVGQRGMAALRILESIVPIASESSARREMARRAGDLPLVRLGINSAFVAMVQEDRPLRLVLDGTRVLRTASFVPRTGQLAGPCWPADCSLWDFFAVPTMGESSPEDVERAIAEARMSQAIASEVYVGCLSSERRLLPFLVLPQPKQYSALHLGVLVLKLVKEVMAVHPRQVFVGACTDAESRAQKCFKILLRPCVGFVEATNLKLLKLPHWAMSLYAPIIGPRAMIFHFSDCNHLLRSLMRNLFNVKLILRLYPGSKRGRDVDCQGIVHLAILRALKTYGFLKHVRSQDMAAHVKLNVDAAENIFSFLTLQCLQNTGFTAFSFVMEAILQITRSYRKLFPPQSALAAAENAVKGITMIRLWRMCLEHFGLRLGVSRTKTRGCASFISTSSYFACEELAQGVVMWVFHKCIREKRPPDFLADLTEEVSNRLENTFGIARGSNRITGECMSLAEFVHESNVHVIWNDAVQTARADGYRHRFTRRKNETMSRLQDQQPADTSFAGTPAIWDEITAPLTAAVDRGVDAALERALEIPQWKDKFATKSNLLSELRGGRFCYESALKDHLDQSAYQSKHLVSSFADLDRVDAAQQTAALWDHRHILFPLSIPGTADMEQYPEEVEQENEDGESALHGHGETGIEPDSDADEAAFAQHHPDFCSQVTQQRNDPDQQAQVDSSISASVVRSFILDSAFSPLLEQNHLTANGWRKLARQANTFREFISRNRQSRFAAGAMPGSLDLATCDSALHINDIVVLKTSTNSFMFAHIAAIHHGRDDVRGVNLGTSNVWVAGIQLELCETVFNIVPEGIISSFSAMSHIAWVLKSGEHYEVKSEETVTATEKLFESLPADVRERRGREVIREWSETPVQIERTETGDEQELAITAPLPMGMSAVRQFLPEDLEPRIIAVRTDGRKQLFCVQYPEGSKELVAGSELDEDEVASFLASGNHRTRRPSALLRDSEMETSATELEKVGHDDERRPAVVARRRQRRDASF